MALRPLPLLPLTIALEVLSHRIVARHPGLLRRLGEHGEKTFVLDPTDLPLLLLLEPRAGQPRVSAHRQAPRADARIAGPISALLGMIHGAYDGDALFFSRDLVIEGDTEVVVALRNAVDGAEINLMEGVMALFGPFSAPVRAAVNTAGKIASRAASDLETLREAMLAPSMRRHDAADAKLRKVTDKVGDLDKRSRRGRKDKS